MNFLRFSIRTRTHSNAPACQRASIPWLAMLLAAVTGFRENARANDPDTIHYPDLQTLAPYNLILDRDHGRTLLRFSNTVANRGRGPLEVFPVNNATDGTTDAYQRLYSHDAFGNGYVVATRFVGKFVFHPEHNHWHFDDFALYQLRNVAPDGSMGSAVLASSGKVTFCITDNTQIDLTIEHAAPQTYTACGVELPQGLSVGWGDTYAYYLAGQSLDITGLPNGIYWLVSLADPDNVLEEGGGAAEANNAGAVKFQILPGKKIKILQ